MSILDFGSRILSTYKADVSDHVSKLKQLKGEEKERAKATIEGNEKVKDSLESQIKSLGKVALAAGAAYAVIKSSIESAKFAMEASRLETGAVGVSIEGLSKAAGGLKTNMQLMRDATALNQTALKGHQGAMEDVELAMRALVHRGNDYEKVNEAVTQALTKGEVDGLKPFGIAVDKAGLSMDDTADKAELFNRVMAALRKETQGFAGDQLTAEERLAATGVTFENSVDKMKKALGDMVVALGPLVEKVAQLVASIPKIGKWLGAKAWTAMGGDDVYKQTNQILSAYEQQDELIQRNLRINAAIAAGNMKLAKEIADEYAVANSYASRQTYGDTLALDHEAKPKSTTDFKANPNHNGKSARDKAKSEQDALDKAFSGDFYKVLGDQLMNLTDLSVQLWPMLAKLDDDLQKNLFFGDARDTSALGAVQRQLTGEDQRMQVMNLSQYADLVKEKVTGVVDIIKSAGEDVNNTFTGKTVGDENKTLMEKWFGKVGEIDMYAESFRAFTGVVTTAYGAMVDGTESLGKAVRHSVADAIKSLGAQMAVESVKELAYGIASIARYDYPGAGAHFLAAAKFAAGATLAGVAAHSLGTSGSAGAHSSGGGAGAGHAPASAGGGGPGGGVDRGQRVIYVVGDPFDENASARQRQNNMRTQVERVIARRGGEY